MANEERGRSTRGEVKKKRGNPHFKCRQTYEGAISIKIREREGAAGLFKKIWIEIPSPRAFQMEAHFIKGLLDSKQTQNDGIGMIWGGKKVPESGFVQLALSCRDFTQAHYVPAIPVREKRG